MDANHQGADGDHVDTQSGGTDVSWPFEWRLTRERSDVEGAARTLSTQWASTAISLFPVALIVIRWPNEQRIQQLRSTLCDFPFSLPVGLSTNEAIFLGQTPTANEGALLCDVLLQLPARYTPVIRMKFLSSLLSFSS